MPEFILLEAPQEFVHECVSRKVTGSHHLRHGRHDCGRLDAPSRRQVEHGGSARASLSNLHRNHKSIRALPASRETAGPRALAERSRANFCGHRTRALAQWTKSPGTYSASRHAGERSRARNWTPNLRHGGIDRTMRSPLRQTHSSARSPYPRAINRPSVAKISLGTRMPSPQTNSKVASSEIRR